MSSEELQAMLKKVLLGQVWLQRELCESDKLLQVMSLNLKNDPSLYIKTVHTATTTEPSGFYYIMWPRSQISPINCVSALSELKEMMDKALENKTKVCNKQKLSLRNVN